MSLLCGSVIAHEIEARSSYQTLTMSLSNHSNDTELLFLSLYIRTELRAPVVIVKHSDAMF